MSEQKPLCPKCKGKQYRMMLVNDDGSATFVPCECTGLTADAIKAFVKAIRGSDE